MTEIVIRPIRAPSATFRPEDLSNIDAIGDRISWQTHDRISVRPFPGHWSMNPSVHFDGETYRCAIRCADHANPNGQSIRGVGSSPNFSISKNAMLILDPETLEPVQCYVMNEDDGWPRVVGSTSRGYEDIRLFQTGSGGLQGIAASLDLQRGVGRSVPKTRGSGQGSQTRGLQRVGGSSVRNPAGRDRDRERVIVQGANQWIEKPGIHPPEQVLLSFDDEYNIVEAKPLRGPWSATPQKNWSPFDNADDPWFLYSIDNGRVFGVDGPSDGAWNPNAKPPLRHLRNAGGGSEIRTVRQPIRLPSTRGTPQAYKGLRGGTQLCYVGNVLDDRFGREIEGGAWLALAHDMVLNYGGSKLYWHLVYVVDSVGELVGISKPIKLAPDKGIEYAAGLVVDGERAVISYGIDDMECWIGETTTSELLSLVEPLEADDEDTVARVNGNGHGRNGNGNGHAVEVATDDGDGGNGQSDQQPGEPGFGEFIQQQLDISEDAPAETVHDGRIPIIGRRRR